MWTFHHSRFVSFSKGSFLVNVLVKIPNMAVTRSDGRQCSCRAQSETLQLSTVFPDLLTYFQQLHFLVYSDLALILVLIAWFPNLCWTKNHSRLSSLRLCLERHQQVATFFMLVSCLAFLQP
jgi:hypothetical protein